MNKRGQESIFALVMLIIFMAAYVLSLPIIHAVIDVAITTSNYTGMMKVFLQTLPFMILLIMLAAMGLLSKRIISGGVRLG